MALSAGTRIGPYEISTAIDVGGLSACGHPSARTWRSEREDRRQFALGVGPQRQ
jgi:hypothetical protein